MVKNKLYRTFTILMAIVVLLSGTGFGLVEHHCMMRGKSIELLSLGESNGCSGCKKVATIMQERAAHPTFNKKACCDESQKHEKVEVVSVAAHSAKLLKAANTTAVLSACAFLSTGSNLTEAGVSQASSLFTFSSLFYGRAMLSFVQSFLI